MRRSLPLLFAALLLPGLAGAVEPSVEDFSCIRDMTPVRGFYVDNLKGDLEATVAVASEGQGTYPPGSVVQLVPTEVMVKREPISLLGQ